LLLKKYRYEFTGNYKIEDDFTLIRFQNDGSEVFNAQLSGTNSVSFWTKGSAKFIFNQGNYALDLKKKNHYCFTIHKKELPLNLELAPNSWVISVIISIKFHALFSN
jgi:hypothetical protein